MGKELLTTGEGTPECCGHRKMREVTVKLWPRVEGIGTGG